MVLSCEVGRIGGSPLQLKQLYSAEICRDLNSSQRCERQQTTPRKTHLAHFKTYSIIVNGLFNVAAHALGVVTQSPAPEARDQYARRHRFWRENWILWREENRRSRRKTLGVRLGSTNQSPRTSPGTKVAVVGGAVDDHYANMTPRLKTKLIIMKGHHRRPKRRGLGDESLML